jgi:hypothetical protein
MSAGYEKFVGVKTTFRFLNKKWAVVYASPKQVSAQYSLVCMPLDNIPGIFKLLWKVFPALFCRNRSKWIETSAH